MACVCRWEHDSRPNVRKHDIRPNVRKHDMNEVKFSVGSNGETF
jgi:hypothetical protein